MITEEKFICQWYKAWFTKEEEFLKGLNEISKFVHSQNIKIVDNYTVYYYHKEKLIL